MNQIGIVVFWLFGIAFALWVLWGVLNIIFRLYVDLRNKALYAVKVEGMIFIYMRHKKEIDEYINRNYGNEVKK